MAEFQITQIASHAYSILDDGGSSFYLVEGRDRSAVIDTGITPGEKILPVIRRITAKPLILILTHAHVDHFHHMDEFETVYMSHREFQLPAEFLNEMFAGKDLEAHFRNTIDLKTNDIISLGSDTLEICEVPGHTPGSIVVLAKEQNLLFTGDAFGSGLHVWMQVPGALPLSEYYQSLTALLSWLIERGGRMKFYGGHNMQQFHYEQTSVYNPLNIGLLADMIDLIDGLVQGEIVGIPSSVAKSFGPEPAKAASFGRAEVVYLPSRIRP